jgi:hypothetical protein
VFVGRESDWGFTNFALLSEVADPEKGFLVDDALQVECQVSAHEPITGHLSMVTHE